MRFPRILLGISSLWLLALSPVYGQVAEETEVEPAALPPSLEELSFRKAFLVANACEAAYLEGAEVDEMLESMGVSTYRFIDRAVAGGTDDTQALVASIEGYTLVCFRGTTGLSDWRTNLRTQPRRIPLGSFGTSVEVHSGFWQAWQDVKPEVVRYLQEQNATHEGDTSTPDGAPCHEVLIGGHSLGGALALAAGVDLTRDGYAVLGVFTFGQPKVFTESVSSLYSAFSAQFPDIQRYVFADDLVPSLPLTGYVHIGEEKYSREVGEILAQPRSGRYWPSVGDHSMSNYVKTLAQLILKLSRSRKTLAMARWLEERERPLASYLGVSPRQAETVIEGFTETFERVRCRRPAG